MPEAVKRVNAVRKFRLASKSAPTQKIAQTPTRFHVENMPPSQFLLVPKVSSERRRYIPVGFMSPDNLVSDLCFIVPGATLYHFGILTSAMHMAWVRQVCGRLESRYRYSNKLVYNNFPWPESPSPRQIAAVEGKAQAVLEARAKFPKATLADLYDPVSMPSALAKAHAKLDGTADLCYRPQAFDNNRLRVEFLFKLYEKLTAPLAVPAKKSPKKKGGR